MNVSDISADVSTSSLSDQPDQPDQPDRAAALFPRMIAYLTGACEAVLIIRLVARMLAARPDNGAIQVLYTLTDPLLLPLKGLDAHLPKFGAVFEVSTFTLVLLLPLLGYVVWRLVIQR